MDLIGRENGKSLAAVIEADSYFSKCFGLTARKALNSKECFLIRGCGSVHTLGMRYSLDIVFIDGEGKAIKVFKNLGPFRITPYVKGAEAVLEFKAGFTDSESIKEGFVFGFKK